MKTILMFACSLLACAFTFALAQDNQQGGTPSKDLPPSPLEAFAARQTTKVVWSTTVGHLDSSYSQAILEVIILENRAIKSTMRGLRIKLAHTGPARFCDWKYSAWQLMRERPNAAVYIEESRMQTVRNQLAQGGG